MRVGLKLYRLLALLACVSLVFAGGNWVHHTHAEAPHFHDETHLVEHEHAHMDRDGGDNGAPFERFIHCGSDLVWISEFQNPRTCAVTHARAGGYLKPVIPVYLNVEKPPPRLIAS